MSDKIDKEEEKYFLAEVYLLLGRIIEWKQPNLALIEYTNAYNILPNIPYYIHRNITNASNVLVFQRYGIFITRLTEKQEFH